MALELFKPSSTPPRRQGLFVHRQAGEEAGREGASGSLGHPGRGHPRAPGSPEPRADAAPSRHPSLRADADRGQGDPAPPAGLHGLQRGLRRRPDGGARAAVHRGAARSARPDDVDQHILHPANGQADHRASQDMVLGLYYLSIMNENEPGQGKAFSDFGELEHALYTKSVTLHTKNQGSRAQSSTPRASRRRRSTRRRPAACSRPGSCRRTIWFLRHLQRADDEEETSPA